MALHSMTTTVVPTINHLPQAESLQSHSMLHSKIVSTAGATIIMRVKCLEETNPCFGVAARAGRMLAPPALRRILRMKQGLARAFGSETDRKPHGSMHMSWRVIRTMGERGQRVRHVGADAAFADEEKKKKKKKKSRFCTSGKRIYMSITRKRATKTSARQSLRARRAVLMR